MESRESSHYTKECQHDGTVLNFLDHWQQKQLDALAAALSKLDTERLSVFNRDILHRD
jgi:hypothetical protein